MRHLAIWSVALVLSASLCSCGGGTLGAGTDTGDINPLKAWSTAIQARGEAAAKAHQALLDVVRIASGDFVVDLLTEPAPADAVDPFDVALSAAIQAQVQCYGAGVHAALCAARATKAPAGGGSGDGGTEIRKLPFAFVLLIVAGVAVTGWGAKKGLDKAINQRAKPVVDKIQAATPAELDIVRDELGLAPDTARDDVLLTYQGLGMSARHSATKKLEEALFEKANQAVAPPDVSEVDAVAIRKAVATSAVSCGEVAVTTTVSLVASAAGGQGYSQTLEALGMGSTAAGTVDVLISAVSTATDTPLQPLDILASTLDVTVASKATNPVTIPKVDERIEADAALTVLSSPTATAAEQEAAAASLALDVIEAHAADLAPRTDVDGAVTVDVPIQVITTQISQPTVEQALVVPTITGDGRADVLIAATDMVPTVFENVDTTQPVRLEYPAVSVDEYGTVDPRSQDGVWTDPATDLVWQKVASAGTAGLEWDEAYAWCANNQAGLPGNDWRMPTISELRSIIRGCEGTVTDGPCGVTDSCLDNDACWTDAGCYECTQGAGPTDGCYWDSELRGECTLFWSSSHLNPNSVWYVNFSYGFVGSHQVSLTTTGTEVRCVRSGP